MQGSRPAQHSRAAWRSVLPSILFFIPSFAFLFILSFVFLLRTKLWLVEQFVFVLNWTNFPIHPFSLLMTFPHFCYSKRIFIMFIDIHYIIMFGARENAQLGRCYLMFFLATLEIVSAFAGCRTKLFSNNFLLGSLIFYSRSSSR